MTSYAPFIAPRSSIVCFETQSKLLVTIDVSYVQEIICDFDAGEPEGESSPCTISIRVHNKPKDTLYGFATPELTRAVYYRLTQAMAATKTFPYPPPAGSVLLPLQGIKYPVPVDLDSTKQDDAPTKF